MAGGLALLAATVSGCLWHGDARCLRLAETAGGRAQGGRDRPPVAAAAGDVLQCHGQPAASRHDADAGPDAGRFLHGADPARGYLRVGVDQNTYLWGYRDPSTGQLTGFDIDMLKQVAQAIFGPSDPGDIRYVIVPNADRVQAVQDGEVDIVAETMTINCEREKSVDFSTVYYQAGQQILVPSDSSITGPQDLGGKRVCATQGSTSLQNLVAPGMPRHIQLWAVNDETDCLVMLQQGQVDAISTDDAILVGLAAQDPNTKIVGPTFSSEPYGMAISKAHPDFTSFVNGVLAQVRAERDLDPDLQRVAGQIHPRGGTSRRRLRATGERRGQD